MKDTAFYKFNWLAIRIHNQFFNAFSDKLHGTVVDVGAGAQPYKKDIEEIGCSYVSVDWENSLDGVKPDVFSDLNVFINLPDDLADHIMCFSVIEHLRDPRILIAEAYRVLKSSGWLYLQVPFQWHIHEAPYDYWRPTKYALSDMLLAAGFQDYTINADTGYWIAAALKFNYHIRRYARGLKLLRRGIHCVLVPVWISTQLLARLLGHLDYNDNETASYTVIARKP